MGSFWEDKPYLKNSAIILCRWYVFKRYCKPMYVTGLLNYRSSKLGVQKKKSTASANAAISKWRSSLQYWRTNTLEPFDLKNLIKPLWKALIPLIILSTAVPSKRTYFHQKWQKLLDIGCVIHKWGPNFWCATPTSSLLVAQILGAQMRILAH